MVLTMLVAAGTMTIAVGTAEAQGLPMASPESVGILQRMTERLQRQIDEDLVGERSVSWHAGGRSCIMKLRGSSIEREGRLCPPTPSS